MATKGPTFLHSRNQLSDAALVVLVADRLASGMEPEVQKGFSDIDAGRQSYAIHELSVPNTRAPAGAEPDRLFGKSIMTRRTKPDCDRERVRLEGVHRSDQEAVRPLRVQTSSQRPGMAYRKPYHTRRLPGEVGPAEQPSHGIAGLLRYALGGREINGARGTAPEGVTGLAHLYERWMPRASLRVARHRSLKAVVVTWRIGENR